MNRSELLDIALGVTRNDIPYRRTTKLKRTRYTRTYFTDQKRIFIVRGDNRYHDNAYLPNRSLHDRSVDRANNCLFARSDVFPMSLRNWLFLPFF